MFCVLFFCLVLGDGGTFCYYYDVIRAGGAYYYPFLP